MSPTIGTDQIDAIVWNLHQHPHAVLGPHDIKLDGKLVKVIRAYIPGAERVAIVDRDRGDEYPMHSVHHPDFFEYICDSDRAFHYQFKVTEGGHERLMHDPYAFRDLPLTDFDRYLFGQGTNYKIYDKMGAHPVEIDGVKGVYFAVWAPNARNVSVIGDFNHWDGRWHQMRRGEPGIWDIFVPGIGADEHYKYEIKNNVGHIYEKTDPFGFRQEIRPKTASIVTDLTSYQWQDGDWMERRRSTDPLKQHISVYEVHLGSWMHESADNPPADGYPVVYAADLKPGARFLTYRELADRLIPYVKELGFTHIELLPVLEHPYDGSWGYQVVGFYAATSRYGTPQDFMYFVDRCHQNGIGVILDWVPSHFPKDGHGLAKFDGTPLFEHPDPRLGEHKGWGTYAFDLGRNEVKNFLIGNALFWFEKYHIDGIRVDAVASMIYRDYCREPGEWLPNEYGGREHLEGVEFFRHLHSILFDYFPGVLSIAEESTSWPMVTWPAYAGGLGFNLKWNMGWMHDMLDYFHMDPWFRQFHNNLVTFSIWYAFSENFMLALSHDEVVHGKSPMTGKMPGYDWDKFANLRCLYSYMFTHPGKKTLFMGMEFGHRSEWNVWDDLEWHLLQFAPHQGIKRLISDLNALCSREPALHELDFSYDGFEWIECNDTHNCVISFLRKAKDGSNVVAICNFTPVLHGSFRIGVPENGFYSEIFNSDAEIYGGSNAGNYGGKWADDWGYHNQPHSIELCIPPFGVLVLKMTEKKPEPLPAAAEEETA